MYLPVSYMYKKKLQHLKGESSEKYWRNCSLNLFAVSFDSFSRKLNFFHARGCLDNLLYLFCVFRIKLMSKFLCLIWFRLCPCIKARYKREGEWQKLVELIVRWHFGVRNNTSSPWHDFIYCWTHTEIINSDTEERDVFSSCFCCGF